MPNVSRINGFRPVKHVTGAPYNGQANIYFVPASDANALFVGDAVKLAADGAAATGVQQVTKATAGAAIVGVVVGILPGKWDPVLGSMSNGSISLDTPQYRPASTAQYVLVCDSPDMLFEVEVTNAGAAYSFAVADVGQNADAYVAGAGSTVTGTSAMSLNSATLAATATLQWKIVGPTIRPDNDPTGANTKVIVKINNHQLSSGTGTAGV